MVLSTVIGRETLHSLPALAAEIDDDDLLAFNNRSRNGDRAALGKTQCRVSQRERHRHAAN